MLRRLSTVFKFSEPSVKQFTPPDVSTPLAQFLSESKATFLAEVRAGGEKQWSVVMGNEAGDLDSIASSIAFAWLQTHIHKKPTIPLIQIEQQDLKLRDENIYALQLAGIDNPAEQLLLLTDLKDIGPTKQIALVDHNRLGGVFSDSPATVFAIVDHHEDEGLYKETAEPRIIAPAGSCSSHIAGLCPQSFPAELATLLLCAILIDTTALKTGGKALKVDYDAAAFLVPLSTLKGAMPSKIIAQLSSKPRDDSLMSENVSLKDLHKELARRKTDLSRLSAWDLLRRDYKEYTHIFQSHPSKPVLKAGLSTVPVALKFWGKGGKLQTEAEAWMKHRGLSILGVLTSFQDARKTRKNGKGRHKREMIWIIRTDTEITYEQSLGQAEPLDFDQVAAKLWAGLEASQVLQVKQHKKFTGKKLGDIPANLRIKAYKQGNADATRKATAPLLKSILEQTDTSSSN